MQFRCKFGLYTIDPLLGKQFRKNKTVLVIILTFSMSVSLSVTIFHKVNVALYFCCANVITHNLVPIYIQRKVPGKREKWTGFGREMNSTCVQMYIFTDLQMQRCADLQMYKCRDVEMYRFTDVSMYRFSYVEKCRCIYLKCADVLRYKYTVDANKELKVDQTCKCHIFYSNQI